MKNQPTKKSFVAVLNIFAQNSQNWLMYTFTNMVRNMKFAKSKDVCAVRVLSPYIDKLGRVCTPVRDFFFHRPIFKTSSSQFTFQNFFSTHILDEN